MMYKDPIVIIGNMCDPVKKEIYGAEILIAEGEIKIIMETGQVEKQFILPGLVDSHIHIESSLLVPSEFARGAVVHGTVATVSDPHEIGNVNGIDGVYYMIENGNKTPFQFNFGAPSCVPATTFETAGATIDAKDIDELLSRDDIKYLSEMMNYPGVLMEFPDVMEKINIAKKHNKPIDGHAPGVMGKDIQKYIESGISTDHECFTLEEALEKIKYGMKILIREGTAARNFEALHSLLTSHPESCMFCSDDKHPDDLLKGHINKLMARAVAKGHDFFDVLRAATLNPVQHYNMDLGLLQIGDKADLCVVKDLKDFEVTKTMINGKYVYNEGKVLIDSVEIEDINNFNCSRKTLEQFAIKYDKPATVKVIDAIEGQLITNKSTAVINPINGNLVSDINQDVLKLTVVNRYQDAEPALAFIRNFGLKRGAIASSVGHDSHNIIAVGVTDEEICTAVNAIIDNKGGLCVVDGTDVSILPLPIAGLMSKETVEIAGKKYTELNAKSAELGCTLNSPFMTASFMALLVIPYIKLSDKGLFDGGKFEFIDLIEN